MFNCGCECIPMDPAADTVKVDMPPPVSEQLEESPPNEEQRGDDVRPPDDEQEQDEQREREREQQQERERQKQESERLAREQERKALVGTFLKEHGYSSVGCPKRTMTKTKYPIHTAAKIGDSKDRKSVV